MYRYKVYFKSSTQLKEPCKAECNCLSFSLNRDLLSEATSTFEVNKVPDVVNEGDVLGLRNNYGKILYLGVVKSIDEQSIQCNQIEQLFDGEWLYRVPNCPTIEEAVYDILLKDFKNNKDPLMIKKYNFDLSFVGKTVANLQVEENPKAKNFKEFLYDLYDKYGVRLYFDIPFGAKQPSIKVQTKEYGKYVMSDNTSSIRNVEITKEVAQYNKLLIYNKSADTLRATYFVTPNGITTNSSDASRLQVIKPKIIFSDDEIEELVSNHLQEQMYNHLIKFDLYLNSNIYVFDKIELGQQIEFVYQGITYNSIFTGYSMSSKELSFVNMTCGKVRNTLDKKIASLFKKIALNE